MNLEQARAKLDSVSNSTAIKHPKVLVAELCVVVKCLLEEIDRIKSPMISVLAKLPSEEVMRDPSPTIPPKQLPFEPPPPPVHEPYDPGLLTRKRRGNAGDAK